MVILTVGQHENVWPTPRRRQRPDGRKSGEDAKSRKPADNHLSLLARTIEAEIIPRLLLANSAMPSTCHKATKDSERPSSVTDELAWTAARNDLAGAIEIVSQQQLNGMSLASVFLDVLAPTARRLGDAWLDDEMNFAEVTIGLALLQQLLRQLTPKFESRVSPVAPGHRALLIAATGEQHALGLFIVEAFFRRAGWYVISGASLPYATVADTIRNEWLDVIAISKSCDGLLDELASDITMFRRISRNQSLTVMVGGGAFERCPEWVTRVGADATAGDGEQAVWRASECVKAKQCSH